MARQKTYPTPDEQWAQTVRYFYAIRLKTSRANVPLIDERDHLGIVVRPHKLLCLGDTLIMQRNNGGNTRFPATGISSKGARLNYYYLEFVSWGILSYRSNRFTVVDLVELPADLIGHRWDDPAVRQFVADLRATRMQPGRRG